MHFEREGRQIAWAKELIGQMWAARAARVLHAANGAGLFARLAEGPATAEDLARRERLDAALAEKVLIACAAMGLVNREGGRWALAPKGRATLVPGSPVYQGHAIAHAGEVQPVWNDLAEHLRGRAGWSQFVEEGETPRRSHADFVLAMHEMAMAGRAAELAARVDLAGCRTLIDVGGGPGTYAMALCERWPDLRATVLDLPETVAIAREVIGGFGTGERVHAAIGDWDSDEFGRDADAALLSNILHGPTSRAEMKLAKAWRALRPGGRLIIQDFLLNDEKTGPLAPALFNIMVGAFSRKELADRIVAAGFLGPHFQAMPEDLGTSLAVAVRPQ